MQQWHDGPSDEDIARDRKWQEEKQTRKGDAIPELLLIESARALGRVVSLLLLAKYPACRDAAELSNLGSDEIAAWRRGELPLGPYLDVMGAGDTHRIVYKTDDEGEIMYEDGDTPIVESSEYYPSIQAWIKLYRLTRGTPHLMRIPVLLTPPPWVPEFDEWDVEAAAQAVVDNVSNVGTERFLKGTDEELAAAWETEQAEFRKAEKTQ